MTVNAEPTRAGRASLRRLPATASAKPAIVATNALTPTAQKWNEPEKLTCCPPKACMSAGGKIAAAPAATANGTKVSRRTSGLSAAPLGVLTLHRGQDAAMQTQVRTALVGGRRCRWREAGSGP